MSMHTRHACLGVAGCATGMNHVKATPVQPAWLVLIIIFIIVILVVVILRCVHLSCKKYNRLKKKKSKMEPLFQGHPKNQAKVFYRKGW